MLRLILCILLFLLGVTLPSFGGVGIALALAIMLFLGGFVHASLRAANIVR